MVKEERWRSPRTDSTPSGFMHLQRKFLRSVRNLTAAGHDKARVGDCRLLDDFQA
jgi:hypothetical protein